MTTPTGSDLDQYDGGDLIQQHAGGVPEDLESGMDELEDGSYPRLRINHKDGRYVESIGDTEWDQFPCIILGFSYSRVMWKERKAGQGFVSDELPQCRSNDNQHGQPNTDPEKPAFFPWKDSVFDPMKAQVNPTYNRVILDCTKCNFQIWGSDGTRPACGLIMTVYVMYQPPGSETPVFAFLSIKGAGIKPMKKFFRTIRQQGNNATPYQFFVTLGLERHVSGDVEFCTPTVAVNSVIPADNWAALSAKYAEMRDYTKSIMIEPDDKLISANGYEPPVSSDPNFFMSADQLRDGVAVAATGGGRRSAPPPTRNRELAPASDDPLAALMGGGQQTIAGSVVQREPNYSATESVQPVQPTQVNQPVATQSQAPVQPQAVQAPPPVQVAPQAPVQAEQNIGTPVQQQPAQQQPPQQVVSPVAVGGMPMMGGPFTNTQQMPQSSVGTVERMPWDNEVPPPSHDFASATVDSAAEEPDGNVSSDDFPWASGNPGDRPF